MRILHVIASLDPGFGGPPAACLDACAELARRGHDVRIFTTGPSAAVRSAGERGAGRRRGRLRIEVFRENTRTAFVSFGLLAALRRRVAEFDVVHIHGLYLWPGMVAGHYARKFKVPYLIQPHGSLDPYIHRRHRIRKWLAERLFEKRNFRGAAAVCFTTEEEYRLAKSRLFGARGRVVPLGLDAKAYAKPPKGRGFLRGRGPRRGRLILFLGRLNFKKGLDILLPAFVKLARKHDDLHLVVAGPDGEGLGDMMLDGMRRAGLRDRMTLTGMLSGRDKLAAYGNATLFVLPSYTENFGISVAEAMACGVPVVISDKVNIWREVKRAGAGVVVPCDPDRLAAAIDSLLGRPRKMKEMGRKGRRLVLRKFSLPQAGRRLEECYRRIVSECRPARRGSGAPG